MRLSLSLRSRTSQPFDEIKHRHTLKEVGNVAGGRYDWKIEKAKQNIQK